MLPLLLLLLLEGREHTPQGPADGDGDEDEEGEEECPEDDPPEQEYKIQGSGFRI